MRGYVGLLTLLASIWGASFLFIKVAVRHMDPAVVMELRLAISAIALVPLLHRRGDLRVLAQRSVVVPAIVLGVMNGAAPFTLIAWGETHVDSGVAAIANGSTPIFVALLAIRFLPAERAAGLELVGIALGLVGVGVLAGAQPDVGLWSVLGTLAVVLASFCYAASNLYIQPRFPAEGAVALVTGSMIVGALVLAPLAAVEHPREWPGFEAVGSVTALAVGGTAFGLLVYYRILRLYGSARASLVTYLLPVTALVYGIALLGEPLTASKLIGLVLILGGVALGSGVLRPSNRVSPAIP